MNLRSAPLAFLLYLGVASSLPASVATVCADPCSDDRPDGHCSPGCACTACGCHSTRPMVPLQGGVGACAPAVARAWPAEGRRPQSPDPGEVFHVPKRDRA